MSHRFFSNESLTSDQATITDDQAHHLINVMRFKVGQQVTLFDGSGCEALAEIVGMNKREVQLAILKRREVNRELSIELVVATSLPKGDRQKFLIEKLVEVGVTRLIPVTTERSVAQPSSKALERLKKSVIAASKQCERNRLMQIEGETRFNDLCSDQKWDSYQKLIATTHGEITALGSVESSDKFLLLIGPEGGFSASENGLASQSGFASIRLGPSILRTETAAIVAAAILGIGRIQNL